MPTSAHTVADHALNLIGEPSAREEFERNFDSFSPPQRRFLLARIESDTDAEARRDARVGETTVKSWRDRSAIFSRVYNLCVKSSPEEMQMVTNLRLAYLAGDCIAHMETYFKDAPDFTAADWLPRHTLLKDKAYFGLSLLKELRSRAAVIRKNSNPTPSDPSGDTTIYEMTRQGMHDAVQDSA